MITDSLSRWWKGSRTWFPLFSFHWYVTLVPFDPILDVTPSHLTIFLWWLTYLFQYFTLSGLKTNLGLLNNGITWGYTILLCVVSFCAKFLPCSIAAKFSGFNWRESGAIGALMSCKG